MAPIAFYPCGWKADEIGEGSHACLHLCEFCEEMQIMHRRPPGQWCEACGFGGLWSKIPEGTDGEKLETVLSDPNSPLRQRIDQRYREWRETPEETVIEEFEGMVTATGIAEEDIEEILDEEISAADMYYDEEDEDCDED